MLVKEVVVLVVLALGKLYQSRQASLADHQILLSTIHGGCLPERAIPKQHSRNPAYQSGKHCSPSQISWRQEPPRIRFHGSTTTREHSELDVPALGPGRYRQCGRTYCGRKENVGFPNGTLACENVDYRY